MAQVPTGELIPDVEPRTDVPYDYQNIEPKAGEGLVALGQGMQKAGQFFGEVAANDAFNNFQDGITKLLYGDPSKTTTGPDGKPMPDTGYLGLKGRAALDARPDTQNQMDQLLAQTRAGLTTPEEKLQFDQYSRRYRSFAMENIGSHADQQANSWYSNVNDASEKNAINHISNNADNPTEVANGAADLINAKVKQAQLDGAQPGGPVWQAAIDSGKQEALKAQVLAIGAGDPARAMRILEKNRNLAGSDYTPLYNDLRVRADRADGLAAGAAALGTAKTNAAQQPVIDSSDPVFRSTAAAVPGGMSASGLSRTVQIEDPSGDPAIRNSSGHVGIGQFSFDTWRAYGGGGDPTNPADSIAAIQRYAAANNKYLSPLLGRPATDAELYLAHQQGPAGAAKLLTNPNELAVNLVGRDAVVGNGGTAAMTAGQFTAMWARNFNGPPMAERSIGSLMKADAGTPPAAAVPVDPHLPSPQQSTEFLMQHRIGGAAGDPQQIAGLQPAMQQRLAAMFQSAPADIRDGLRIVSGYRDNALQAKLYAASGGSGMVAPPGRSMHNVGAAADIGYAGEGGLNAMPSNVVQWLHANAPKYGLKFPLSFENWHVELAETRGGKPFASANPAAAAQTPAPEAAAPQGAVNSPVFLNNAPAVAAPVSPAAPAAPSGEEMVNPAASGAAAPAPAAAPAAAPQETPSLKASAYQQILNDGTLSEEAKSVALDHINRQLAAEQIAEDANTAQRKQASDKAAGTYVTQILTGNVAGLSEQIANDPQLEWQTKEALTTALQAHAGQSVSAASAAYGPGFWSAYKQVVASPDDPSHIADPTALLRRAGPGGDLTLDGVAKLTQTMSTMQRSVDDTAVNQTKLGLMNYAKSKLSFQQDTGPVQIKDPTGEALFNSQFIPKFEASYDKVVKDGKDPWSFLTKDNVDKMIDGMRNSREMALARLMATENPGVDVSQLPAPPPPTGADPDAWRIVVNAPPKTGGGAPWPTAAWAGAVTQLQQHPTPDVIKQFDAKFGPQGITAADVLSILKAPGSPEAAPAAAAPPGAALPPAHPHTPTPPQAAPPEGDPIGNLTKPLRDALAPPARPEPFGDPNNPMGLDYDR